MIVVVYGQGKFLSNDSNNINTGNRNNNVNSYPNQQEVSSQNVKEPYQLSPTQIVSSATTSAVGLQTSLSITTNNSTQQGKSCNSPTLWWKRQMSAIGRRIHNHNNQVDHVYYVAFLHQVLHRYDNLLKQMSFGNIVLYGMSLYYCLVLLYVNCLYQNQLTMHLIYYLL
jgi:hypothetical protein